MMKTYQKTVSATKLVMKEDALTAKKKKKPTQNEYKHANKLNVKETYTVNLYDIPTVSDPASCTER